VAQGDPRSPGPVTRVVVALLLVAPFAVYLAVPSYARVKPRLAGFPFFYWWQLLWVIITAVFIGIAYLLTRPRGEAPAPASEGGE
jgi:Protein of unknown function (DUF3311)